MELDKVALSCDIYNYFDDKRKKEKFLKKYLKEITPIEDSDVVLELKFVYKKLTWVFNFYYTGKYTSELCIIKPLKIRKYDIDFYKEIDQIKLDYNYFLKELYPQMTRYMRGATKWILNKLL